jgi:predicted nucleotidyltransferase
MSTLASTGEPKYYRMGLEERERLLEGVRGISFAYVHGSFVERELLRDVDVALWIEGARGPL